MLSPTASYNKRRLERKCKWYNYEENRSYTVEENIDQLKVSPEQWRKIRDNIMCPLTKVIPLTLEEQQKRKLLKIRPNRKQSGNRGNWANYGL